MIKKIILSVIAFQCLTGAADAKQKSFLFSEEKPSHIFVNNRILAKVNGNAISAIDVMKKLDMLFYRQFPQYSSSVEARFQFYQVNWKHILNEMIEKELIIADAEENKLETSNGDIRQEMETLFGPNIIGNLDKAGLTYDDAWKIVKEDLLIKRMIFIRVNSKAVRSVTPSDVRVAYEQFAKENARPDTWEYQVLSLRGDDAAASEKAASRAHEFLLEGNTSYDEIKKQLEEESLITETTTLNISENYRHTEKEVSEAYKEILSTLEQGSFSEPIAQKSRAKNAIVYRIFHLKEILPGGVPPFQVVENKVRGMLIDNIVDKESDEYINRLRKHFAVQEGTEHQMFPEDYQPFALQ